MGHEYMSTLNEQFGRLSNALAISQFEHECDLNNEQIEANYMKATEQMSNFSRQAWQRTIKFNVARVDDRNLKRKFRKMSTIGEAVLGPEGSSNFTKKVTTMKQIYSRNQKVAKLSKLANQNGDYDAKVGRWLRYNSAGSEIRDHFLDYCEMTKQIAEASSVGELQFTDYGQLWRHEWEVDDLQEQFKKMMMEIEPLYKKLHAYLRMCMRKQYGQHLPPDGTIPTPLYSSSIWRKCATPFPEMQSFDFSSQLVKQNYTVERMFRTAEDFFVSLGLKPMTDKFWANSVFVKPKGRSMVCHPSAWDMSDPEKKDYRIKMCGKVNKKDFVTIHHEMGHVAYFMAYCNQPFVYREGANSGFHEAIGDTIALAAANPKHLFHLGLIEADYDNYKSMINFQFEMAIDKVMSAPFACMIDYWRYRCFSGEYTAQNMNQNWWKLNIAFRGLSPPVQRCEKDFDPGNIFHVAANVPYDRYFAAKVLQFSFYDSLCKCAGDSMELCDFYGNKEAGQLLGSILCKGSSVPWQHQLNVFTGSPEMSADSMVRYFSPLEEYMTKELLKNGERIGWDDSVVNNYLI
ncbi:Angiotensin-converting enzyme [Halotydeus destructor]|nr:Angiotensin-converting enzyme [Halotydeus destructor]